MSVIRSWSRTFHANGQRGPSSSCRMAASVPPPSATPRAIRRTPCRGTSCVPNTGSWDAVCCLRTGFTRSARPCNVWSPLQTWPRSGEGSVPPWAQTSNVALLRVCNVPHHAHLGTQRPHCACTPDGGPPLRWPRLHWEPFQQPAGDDEPLDLVRAFAHGEELRVAEVALHGQLLDIAHAAVDLDGLAGAELGSLGGEELGHACLEVAALACRLERGRLVGQELGGLDARRHLGELGLDELVLRDGLPKGLTLLGIADRVLEGRPGQADAARRHIDAPALEGTHDHWEARVLLAEQILQRHARVLKDELARAQPTVAQLLQVAADPDARRALVDEQAGDAPRLGPRWIGADKHAKHGAVLGVGDEHLLAVFDPLVLLSTCRGTQRRRVRARARFSQCHTRVPCARGHLRQVRLALRVGAE